MIHMTTGSSKVARFIPCGEYYTASHAATRNEDNLLYSIYLQKWPCLHTYSYIAKVLGRICFYIVILNFQWGLCTLYHIRLWFNALAVPRTLGHFWRLDGAHKQQRWYLCTTSSPNTAPYPHNKSGKDHIRLGFNWVKPICDGFVMIERTAPLARTLRTSL